MKRVGEGADSMKLAQLVASLRRVRCGTGEDVEITALAVDSRDVGPGTLFIALRGGGIQDRHQYIPDVVARGAAALVVEEEQPGIAMPQIVVPDIRIAAGILADAFYRHPSGALAVIGITGTNGKTTVARMIDVVLTAAGHRTGVLGTLGKQIDGVTVEGRNTTPEATGYQAALAEMMEAGCAYAVTEVSSQALDLRRVTGTRFHAAVFTNLTQDHLDYHGTFDAYLTAKALLFSRLGNASQEVGGRAPYGVLNADDAASAALANHAAVECYTYGLRTAADVTARDVVVNLEGISFTAITPLGSVAIRMSLSGQFNVYNALAAVTVGLAEGIPLTEIATALENMAVVPGRLEKVSAPAPFSVLVDYSHTPDGLENALSSAQGFTETRLICVVGCGGDRDKAKRPMMARIAVAYSDIAIFTSDNPRSEDPDAILDDMVAGLQAMTGQPRGIHERIRDRRLAIQRAILLARPGDVVVIAGKGHETYQIIGSTTYHFDDKQVALEAMSIRGE